MIALGAPTAECRCVVIDGAGVAIYVADITYRSEVIRSAHRPACPFELHCRLCQARGPAAALATAPR